MIKQYELMVLLPVSMTQDQINGFSKSVRALLEVKGGSIVEEQNLGRKMLAYDIKKQREAVYVLYRVNADTTATQQFERDIRLDERVMRSLLTIVEE